MKLLIIGGKKFLGYHIAKVAVNNGHDVTYFNRGKTYSEALPEIPTIIGDRNLKLGESYTSSKNLEGLMAFVPSKYADMTFIRGMQTGSVFSMF